MAKAKVYGAVTRVKKGRSLPKPKREKESWKRRNLARQPKQEAFAATVATAASVTVPE